MKKFWLKLLSFFDMIDKEISNSFSLYDYYNHIELANNSKHIAENLNSFVQKRIKNNPVIDHVNQTYQCNYLSSFNFCYSDSGANLVDNPFSVYTDWSHHVNMFLTESFIHNEAVFKESFFEDQNFSDKEDNEDPWIKNLLKVINFIDNIDSQEESDCPQNLSLTDDSGNNISIQLLWADDRWEVGVNP